MLIARLPSYEQQRLQASATVRWTLLPEAEVFSAPPSGRPSVCPSCHQPQQQQPQPQRQRRGPAATDACSAASSFSEAAGSSSLDRENSVIAAEETPFIGASSAVLRFGGFPEGEASLEEEATFNAGQRFSFRPSSLRSSLGAFFVEALAACCLNGDCQDGDAAESQVTRTEEETARAYADAAVSNPALPPPQQPSSSRRSQELQLHLGRRVQAAAVSVQRAREAVASAEATCKAIEKLLSDLQPQTVGHPSSGPPAGLVGLVQKRKVVPPSPRRESV